MYRVFKTNSYRDLDGAWGSITDLFTDKSQLYCSTPKALWFIPTSPQRLTTNESNIYVGTGDILSVPPSLISSTLQGYGGSTYQHTRTSTEFGNFLIDDRSRKILHLADGLKEISAKGMSNFFEENLPLQLDKAVYSQTGVHYQKLYPHSHEGIGYQIAYDPKFRRVIVSKKDYKPLLPVGLIGQTVIPNKLFYDSANNIFYVWSNGRVQRVNLWDEAYFENVSFTVSYSLEFQAWSSFHSYLPNFIFNDNKTFYTSIDEGLYDHSIGNFQTYYGDKKDHILEVISNQSPSQTKVFTGLTYSAIVEDYMSTQKAYRTVQDVTFSRLIAYTQDQTTGLQDIVVKTNSFDNIIQLDGASVAAYYKDSTWYINELRDMNISHGDIPIFSSA